MYATISPSLGYCIIDAPNGEVELLSSVEMNKVEVAHERHSLSLARDWKVLETKDTKTALLETKRQAENSRCASLIKLRLQVTDKEKGDWLLEKIESMLVNCGDSTTIIKNLIIAPIANPDQIKQCADDALGGGFAVAAHLYNRLFNFQPLILRLSNIWLRLPNSHFLNLRQSKEEFWVNLVESGKILEIVEAPDGHTIKKVFGELAFDIDSPSERATIANLGRAIADAIYGDEIIENDLAAELYEDDAPVGKKPHDNSRQGYGYIELQRALNEINGIVNALSRGDDYNAERFLRDLIDRQTEAESKIEYAIKSLCNIAKQCADMFRSDFEYICLAKARELDLTDGWTMIQLGDHYKRSGKYQEAKEIINTAISTQPEVGQSLLADVSSQEGNYQEAIAIYKSIEGWQNIAKVRTAIADNYRRLGLFNEAMYEYEKLESEGLGSNITLVGKAEIAKNEGRLNDAIQIYQSIIESLDDKNNRDWWIYRISYASILKQAGHYNEAFVLTEEVISEVPFSMQARVLRASICGLLGNVDEGLKGLPKEFARYTYTAFGEWVSEYIRGLLLLQTSQYNKAQKKLISSLRESVLENEDRAILRLAAALAYLANESTIEAKQLLSESYDIKDSYVRYLSNMLRYHISILEKDQNNADILFKKLESDKDNNIVLWPAVEAIQEGRLDSAILLEIDAMLRIAA